MADLIRLFSPPAFAETHASIVLFLDEVAYKIKKPVRMDFLDFTSPAAREAACRREVALNRRLAPDVYLGVIPILGLDGAPCDWAVVMRRLPDDRRLAGLVGAGASVSACLRAIVRDVETFHARAETSAAIASYGRAESVWRNWEDNFAQMGKYAGTLLPESGVARAAHLAGRYLRGREPLFAARAASGKVRDCHGDLKADDIFCMDDGPRILDCVEFNDEFRYVDVLSDIAFLVMDLERLGRLDLADEVLSAYREFSGDTFPRSLADHYIAYRAQVRSKVACLRCEQGDPESGTLGVQLHDLAVRHLESARVRLVLVGGGPGTGKSTLAAGLAELRGWQVLRSDEIRKDLAGVPRDRGTTDRFHGGIYSREMTAATYDTMLARARLMLESGESTVLDATWSHAGHREAAAKIARETESDLVELRCDVPLEVAGWRIAGRGDSDPSDATPRIAKLIADSADPWPSARTIDTRGRPDASVRLGLSCVDEG